MTRTKLNGHFQTPWGAAQVATQYAPGIIFYETAGHGGFGLQPEREAELLAKFPGFRPFCGRSGWYEEDCDSAAVILTWPDLFPGSNLAEVRSMVDNYCTWDGRKAA